ncbi:MAG: nitroreductase family protein [Candidatus Aerophobetes bacterium]|nr:nitroreductase family protein [Candidatus Aerophobetes bacterium]
MEVLEAIKGRRSIRSFKDKKIPQQLLKKIMEAAIWSPSGSNAQAWEFIVVNNSEEIKKIKILSPGMFDLPAAVVIVCIDLKRAYDIAGELGREILSLMDISMASQNIMLRAYELGIGSCAVRSFGISAIKKLFNLPDHISPELLITLGYPEKIPDPPKRRKIDEVIRWWKG